MEEQNMKEYIYEMIHFVMNKSSNLRGELSLWQRFLVTDEVLKEIGYWDEEVE